MRCSVRFSRFRPVALVALVVLAVAGCGGSKSATPPGTSTTSTDASRASAPRDRWGTVWLCRPGEAADPCTSSLGTTVVGASGAKKVEPAAPAKDPGVDCFYVYPTVSDERTVNANLQAGFRETEVAIAQASRFSQVCKV